MRKLDKALPRLGSLGSAAALAALALSLAACSASPGHSATAGSSSSPSSSGPMLGATFSGTIYVSSATSEVTKAFTDHVADVQNCAAAAKDGWDGTFHVPSPHAPSPVADIQISGFHGPGTYTPTMLKHDRADTILLTSKAGTSHYYISPGGKRTAGKEVLFLNKDGAGQLVYSGAHLNGAAASPAVAGLIQWSCKS